MARGSAKTRRCYCLLPEDATSEDATNRKCGVGGHSHLNFVELYGGVNYAEAGQLIQALGPAYLGKDGMLDHGEVEWLCFPRVLRRKQGIVELRVSVSSASVGEYLAKELRRAPRNKGIRQSWSHLMFAHILNHDKPERATRKEDAALS